MAYRVKVAELSNDLSKIAGLHDETERFLRVVAILTRLDMVRGDAPAVAESLIKVGLERYLEEDPGNAYYGIAPSLKPKWSSVEIGRWFAEKMRVAKMKPNSVFDTSEQFKGYVRLPVWYLPEGAGIAASEVNSNALSGQAAAYVTESGDVFCAGVDIGYQRKERIYLYSKVPTGLSWHGLFQLATILGF